MRRLILVLMFTATVAATDANAQVGAITIMCEACRNPNRYSEDWANFAFNQVYGQSGWLDFDQADDFFIVNLHGDRVYADIDFVMGGIRILGNTLPIWPTNLVLVTLALPDGQVVQYLRSVFQHPLPVPAPSEPDDDASQVYVHPGHEWADKISRIEWQEFDTNRQ